MMSHARRQLRKGREKTLIHRLRTGPVKDFHKSSLVFGANRAEVHGGPVLESEVRFQHWTHVITRMRAARAWSQLIGGCWETYPEPRAIARGPLLAEQILHLAENQNDGRSQCDQDH